MRREQPWRAVIAPILVAVAIIGFGLAMHTSDAEAHVGDAADKVATTAKLYGWPFSDAIALVERLPESARFFPAALLQFPRADGSWMLAAGDWLHRHAGVAGALYFLLAAGLQAPVLALLVALWRRRVTWSSAMGPLGLATFAGFMLAATAMARAGQTTVAVRYLDHVALAGFAAIAAAFLLAARAPRRPRWIVAWAVVMTAGYFGSIAVSLVQLNRRYPDACLAVMQNYFATNDPTILTRNDTYRAIVYDATPGPFLALLKERQLRAVLPRAVLAPNAPPGRAPAVASFVGKWSPLLVLLAGTGAAWVSWYPQRRQVRVNRPVVAVTSTPA